MSRAGVLGFLDFIAWPESRGNWNAVWGNVDNNDDPPLTRMTVAQILDWQKDRRHSAAGRYQIIRKTLGSLVVEMSLTGTEIYDPDLQDRMATTLLRRRGLNAFFSGQMPAPVFALNVAREWAALPGTVAPFFDRSVYAGDGVNKALIDIDAYLAAIERLASETG